MSLNPSWSLMKNRLPPSGEYCGLRCLPRGKGENTLTFPLATSTVASCSGEKVIEVKSVVGPRSVEKATVRPSGDQAGCRSAWRSFVS
jgi:hypothetical protein